MKTFTISKEIAERNLSQAQIRESRKAYSPIQTFTHEDILNQRYYHKDYSGTGYRYSNGDRIQIGTHGPEEKNRYLYMTIYHYLEYILEDPNKYDTLDLGLYLTSKSDLLLGTLSTKYISCKYEKYPHNINKYELEFLRQQERTGVFENYRCNARKFTNY